MKKTLPKNSLPLLTAFVASAVMLTIIQLPAGWSFLAWAALVPFILVCNSDIKVSTLFIVAYVVSFCYWLGNLYWMMPVTTAGLITLCLYMAVLWPLVAVCLRFCVMKKAPLFLAVPALIVGAERLQGVFWGGFFWRYLAHSQYANIPLIQISDIFGAAGVSFLIAMANGLLAELIISAKQRNILKPAQLLKIVFVCGAVVAAIFYGRWRINQSVEFIETGPVVAAVQSNVPQSVKESYAASEEMFDNLLKKSDAAAKANATLIVWPETMVQAILDDRVLKILDSSHPYNVYNEAIKKHAKEINAYILAGAHGGVPLVKPDMTIELAQKYNSAFLYRSDGIESDKQYNKIHLVPFGEVVPFKKKFPPLYRLLMKLTPYDYDYSLDYGSEYTVFGMNSSGRVYRFGVMICYEDTVPSITRKFTLDENGSKKADWLVNISNDGWFVRFSRGQVYPSAELSQHTAICVFRAVENRQSILRSVNTGISCLIDSLGRIKDGYLASDLPKKAIERQGVGGWFADNITIDKRISFFSKYGQWLDFCCTVVFVSLIILQVSGWFLRKRIE